MTVQEIFSQIAAHMVRGLMIHDQLADYFNFLGLEGYHLEQEHQYLEESKEYRDLPVFYMQQYDLLLATDRVEDPKIIPDSWRKHNRMEVDISTKRNAIESGFKAWRDWEKATIKIYSDLARELYAMGDIIVYCYLTEIIKTVNVELLKVVDRMLVLNSTNYDMTYILEAQKDLIEKYKG